MLYEIINTPVGEALLACDEIGLRYVSIGQPLSPRIESGWHRDKGALRLACEQIKAYFAGELKYFELKLAAIGTNFQRSAWKMLGEIPYGATISYGQLATRLGHPKASRAVGAANRCNPLCIVVPCHRVIAANGGLGGYRGGIKVKQYLLALEAKNVCLTSTMNRVY